MTELVPKTTLISGDEAAVRRSLTTLQRNRHLLTHPRDIQLMRLPGGRVSASVLILTLPELTWRKRHPVLLKGLIGAGISVALLGLVGGVLYFALRAVGAALDRPGALGVLFVAGGLLLAVLSNRSNHRGACTGVAVHCRGCKH
jgi:hypothetical protein